MTLSTRASVLSLLASCTLIVACSDDGNEAATTGTGGTTVTGAGGGDATGAGGGTASDSGGTTAAAGADSGDMPVNRADFVPLCSDGPTQAGDEIKKGTACTAEDVQMCYRTCGPLTMGFKTETCNGATYAEGNCAFPQDDDYSCFAIPETQDAACPADTAPQATMECDVPECSPCSLDGSYANSSGEIKTGYCVCKEPDADGVRSWTCATNNGSWPCPGNPGC